MIRKVNLKDYIYEDDVLELAEESTTFQELVQKIKERFEGVFAILMMEELEDYPKAEVIDVTNYAAVVRKILKAYVNSHKRNR